jgi:choice-of-anchor C domain-containing protein
MKIFIVLIGLIILLALCGGCIIINVPGRDTVNPQISTTVIQTTPLVSNGGFETPVSGYPFTTMAGNQLTGWSIDYGSIDLINGGVQPHSGSQSIDLSGNSPALISQRISTVPGGEYTLRFWMAGNPDRQEVKSLGVFWNGNELNPILTFDSTGHTGTDMGWKLVTVSNLIATSSSTEIAFLDRQHPDDPYGVMLDDVSIVPE